MFCCSSCHVQNFHYLIEAAFVETGSNFWERTLGIVQKLLKKTSFFNLWSLLEPLFSPAWGIIFVKKESFDLSCWSHQLHPPWVNIYVSLESLFSFFQPLKVGVSSNFWTKFVWTRYLTLTVNVVPTIFLSKCVALKKIWWFSILDSLDLWWQQGRVYHMFGRGV